MQDHDEQHTANSEQSLPLDEAHEDAPDLGEMTAEVEAEHSESNMPVLPKETVVVPLVYLDAGLVEMQKDGQIIHAHPTVVEEHKSHGWKVS